MVATSTPGQRAWSVPRHLASALLVLICCWITPGDGWTAARQHARSMLQDLPILENQAIPPLVPTVAHFDAWAGLVANNDSSVLTIDPVTGQVLGWNDVQLGRAQALTMFGNCTYDSSPEGAFGSIVLDGTSCMGVLGGKQLANWNTSAEAPFTIVLVYWLANDAVSRRAWLASLNRSPRNNFYVLVWLTGPDAGDEFLLYDTTSRTSRFNPFVPTGRWVMEVVTRDVGGTSLSYYRSPSPSDNVTEVTLVKQWTDQVAVPLPGRDLALAGDWAELVPNTFAPGRLALAAMYNTSLSQDDVNQLYRFYAPRFSWYVEPESPPAPDVGNQPPLAPSPATEPTSVPSYAVREFSSASLAACNTENLTQIFGTAPSMDFSSTDDWSPGQSVRATISSIAVWYGSWIEAIQVSYGSGSTALVATLGSRPLTMARAPTDTLQLLPGEQISYAFVYYGPLGIYGLVFRTTLNNMLYAGLTWGPSRSPAVPCPTTSQFRLAALWGNAGTRLQQISLQWELVVPPDPSTPSPAPGVVSVSPALSCLAAAPLLGIDSVSQTCDYAQDGLSMANYLTCPRGTFVSSITQVIGRTLEGKFTGVAQITITCSDGFTQLGPLPPTLSYAVAEVLNVTTYSSTDGFRYAVGQFDCVATSLEWYTDTPMQPPDGDWNTKFGCDSSYERISAVRVGVGQMVNAMAFCCAAYENRTAITTPDTVPGLVGWYEGSSWDATVKIWVDKSPAGNNATMLPTPWANVVLYTSPMNGTTYLVGNKFTSITFPTTASGDYLPRNYTLLHVARYISSQKGRIFTTDDAHDERCNWLSGFYDGSSGVAYRDNAWLTASTDLHGMGWVLSTQTPDMYRSQGYDRTLDVIDVRNASGTNCAFGINLWASLAGDASDWAVAAVLVYNRVLDPEEIEGVEQYLAQTVVATLPAAAPSVPDAVPIGTVMINGSLGTQYMFSDATRELLSYMDCRNACWANGAVAPIINSGAKREEMLEVFKDAASRRRLTYWTYVWIGLTRNQTEGSWFWEDGSPLGYNDWWNGEPSNTGGWEDCAQAHPLRGLWNDMPCIYYRYSCMCEVPPVPLLTLPFSFQKGTADPTLYGTVIATNSSRYWIGQGPNDVYKQPMPYLQCSYVCAGIGGQTPVIPTIESLPDVLSAVWQADSMQLLLSRSIWVGLSRVSTSGGSVFQWSNGLPLNYSAWQPGQPDNADGQEACVDLNADTVLWSDLDCQDEDVTRSCLCQLPAPEPLPPPTAPPLPPPASPAPFPLPLPGDMSPLLMPLPPSMASPPPPSLPPPSAPALMPPIEVMPPEPPSPVPRLRPRPTSFPPAATPTSSDTDNSSSGMSEAAKVGAIVGATVGGVALLAAFAALLLVFVILRKRYAAEERRKRSDPGDMEDGSGKLCVPLADVPPSTTSSSLPNGHQQQAPLSKQLPASPSQDSPVSCTNMNGNGKLEPQQPIPPSPHVLASPAVVGQPMQSPFNDKNLFQLPMPPVQVGFEGNGGLAGAGGSGGLTGTPPRPPTQMQQDAYWQAVGHAAMPAALVAAIAAASAASGQLAYRQTPSGAGSARSRKPSSDAPRTNGGSSKDEAAPRAQRTADLQVYTSGSPSHQRTLQGWQSDPQAGAIEAFVPNSIPRWNFQIDPNELTIKERLGCGGYGEVFRGMWRGTIVAVKLMRLDGMGREEMDKCKAEIKLMFRLHHPNIVHIFGATVMPSGHLAIVMELVARGSLYDVLHKNKQPLDPRKRLRMAMDMARGMEYLHGLSPPLVHRDIKSPNLLVAADWGIKLCDFGLSKPKNATFITTNTSAGTPAWMAPEVLMGRKCNEKSDVYSYGVVLYELVTGEVPWRDVQHSAQLYHKVGHEGLRPELPEGLDEALVRLIQCCWAQDPEERPSFPEVLAILRGMGELRAASEVRGSMENRVPSDAGQVLPSPVVLVPPRPRDSGEEGQAE